MVTQSLQKTNPRLPLTTYTYLGCRPTPRSYSNWNFKVLDPAAAVFAKEVLNKNQNIIEDMLKLGISNSSISNYHDGSSKNFNDSSMKMNSSYRDSQLYHSPMKNSPSPVLGVRPQRRGVLQPLSNGTNDNASQKSNAKMSKTRRTFRELRKRTSHPIG